MVAGLEAELGRLAHLAQRHRVLLGFTVRSLGIREVGQRHEELGALRLHVVELRLELLELGAHLAHLGDQRLGVVADALGLCDPVRRTVLPRAPLLDLREQLPTAGVHTQQLVELLGGTSARQRGPRGIRILADAPQVEHYALSAGGFTGGRAAPRGRPVAYGEPEPGGWTVVWALEPAYFETNRATSEASLPVTMFWGMIAPEKPPLRIAKMTSW